MDPSLSNILLDASGQPSHELPIVDFFPPHASHIYVTGGDIEMRAVLGAVECRMIAGDFCILNNDKPGLRKLATLWDR